MNNKKEERATPTKALPFFFATIQDMPTSELWHSPCTCITMIHKKGITCKLILLKSLPDSFLFDQAVKLVNLDDCVCPFCDCKGQFRKIMPYHRSMISVRDGQRDESSVSVPRAICKACGHTHAILPDILIPFSSYSIRFVLTVLTEYCHKSCTVAELCSKWQISVSTLYTWIHLFQEHSEAWAKVSDIALEALSGMLSNISRICSFPFRFRISAGFFFLQNSSKFNRFPYIHNSEIDFFPDVGYDNDRCTEPCCKGFFRKEETCNEQ